MSRLRVTLAGRWGPVLLAVAFGLPSMPLVWSLLVQPPPESQQIIVGAPPVGWLDALLLSMASVATASVAGGSLGGILVRSRPLAAALVAIGTAWPVGIGMLSIAAAALGIEVRIAIVCVDTCSPEITNQEPLSGFGAYFEFVWAAFPFLLPLGAFIVLDTDGLGTSETRPPPRRHPIRRRGVRPVARNEHS